MKKLLTFALVLLGLLSCSKNDYVPVSNIALSTFDLQLALNAYPQYVIATVMPSDATNQELSWVSRDESVATVSQNGKVTPVSVGSTWVDVTAKDNGVSVPFKVTVSDVEVLVTDVVLESQEATLRVGEAPERFNAVVLPEDADDKTLLWSSSDTAVITVSGGLVTPVGIGTATVRAAAKTGSGVSSCSVLVKAQDAKFVNVSEVSLNKPSLGLYPGQKYQLQATVLPYEADSKKIQWESSNVEVATVTCGLVKALKAGDALVTVRTRDGNYEAYCSVKVENPE